MSYQELVYLGLSIRSKDVGFEIVLRKHVTEDKIMSVVPHFFRHQQGDALS
jgi:hypothetical protein